MFPVILKRVQEASWIDKTNKYFRPIIEQPITMFMRTVI